jgi:TolA-binding protein
MWNDAEPDDAAAAAFFRPRSDEAQAGCPRPDLIQASQAGVLPPELQQRVAAHVAHCVVCQALVDALDDSSVGSLTAEEQARIRQRVDGELSRLPRALVWNRSWHLAAACAVLVAAGSLFVWQSRQRPTAPTPDASSVFHLEKPSMRAPDKDDLVWRGASRPEEAQDLARALEPYDANNFAEAARRLQQVVSRYPQSAAGHFYLGVCDLFLGRDADGATALENAERLAKDQPDVAREAKWYLAVAYRRLGQNARAAAQLDALCLGGGPRAVQACAGLRELSTSSPSPRSR